MWDKPFRFVIVNLATYVILLSLFGFWIAPVITICLAFFIFFYNLRFVNSSSAVCLAILYLLVFDSKAYTFTSFNFRLWYFPLVLLLLNRLFEKNIRLSKNSAIFFYLTIILLLFSLYYLIIENFEFKLHIVKYWLFSVGLIYTLIFFFKKHLSDPIPILKYLLSLVVFVTLYGFVQYLYDLAGDFSLINTAGNVRPEAFFSETTWYAEYILLGFICVFLLAKLTNRREFLLLDVFFFVGLLISNTRNAFVGLLMITMVEIVYFFARNKIKTTFSKKRMIAILTVLLLTFFVLALNFQIIKEQAVAVINKFDVKNEPSAKGRMQAFEISLEMAKKTPLFGYGFYHSQEFEVGEGNTAVGAKSFNLLFMIYHIFGPVGFVLFFTMIVCYFYLLIGSTLRSQNIFFRMALSVFLVFFVMAMFAPIHQFPIGMYYIAFSVYLFNCGLNEKHLLYNA